MPASDPCLLCVLSTYKGLVSFHNGRIMKEGGIMVKIPMDPNYLRISGTLHNHSTSSLVKQGLWYLPQRAVLLYV